MRYYIFKLPVSNPAWCREPGDKVNLGDYVTVWTGEIEEKPDVEEMLEHLFKKFNIAHPDNYAASSMSTGDLVGFKKDTEIEYYGCCFVGWKRVAVK